MQLVFYKEPGPRLGAGDGLDGHLLFPATHPGEGLKVGRELMGPHWSHIQTLNCGLSLQGSDAMTWVQARPLGLCRLVLGQGPGGATGRQALA